MRSHEVVVDGPTTTFALPRYFGRRRWTVPTATIGVRDLATTPATPSDEVLVFERPVLDVWLPTGSKLQSATTSLRFREPVRIPPVRRLAGSEAGIDRRASHSAAGVRLDGLHLAFRDPAAARRALLAAGAEPIVDDLAWWRRWRSTRTDPAEGRALTAAARDARRSVWVAYGLLTLFGVLAVVARDRGGWFLVGVCAVTGGAAVGYLTWLRAHVRRQVRAAREAADRRGGFRSGP